MEERKKENDMSILNIQAINRRRKHTIMRQSQDTLSTFLSFPSFVLYFLMLVQFMVAEHIPTAIG